MSAGDTAMAEGEYAKAQELYASESKSGADADRAHDGLIRAELRQSKVADAEKDAAAWAAAQPNNAWALSALAEVQWREGKDADAVNTNTKARSLDYCNPRAHADLAAIWRMGGYYASASREIALAHRFDPVDSVIAGQWLRLQPVSVQTEKLDNALADKSLPEDERKSLTRWKERLVAPESSCHLVTPVASTTIPFHGIQDGPNAATYWGLQVEFNGKGRRLEIDTGASGLVLSKAAAAALHLEPEQSFKMYGIGDDGNVDSFIAKVHSIKIGGLEFQDCDVQVLGTNAKGFDAEDGLIGGDVFSHFILTLDFPGRILKLDPLPARPSDTPDQSAPTLQTGVSADTNTPQDPYVDPSMKDWSRIWRSGHDLILRTQINQGPWALFIMDTGAATNLISANLAHQVSKYTSNTWQDIYGISGQAKKTFNTQPLKLRFANLIFPAESLTAIDTSRFSTNPGVEISGFIGAPILRQLTVSIDYRDNLIHFSYDPKRLNRCVAGLKITDCD